MGFRVIATLSHDWIKIAELAGANPFLNIWHPGTSELECEAINQTTLDTAFAGYVADQTNIDAATEAARIAAEKDVAKNSVDVERIVRALIELLPDEFNILRTLHSLPDRTVAGLTAALKANIDASVN